MTARQPVRIAAAWPYSGGNLGDTVIVSATLLNLRKHVPGAEIIGLTLHPGNVKRLHGIEGYPLSAAPIEFYGSGRWDLPSRNHQTPIRRLLRRLRSIAGFIRREVPHWVRALLVMRRVDVLVFPGSGQLDDSFGGAWGHPYAMFKWSVAGRLTGATVLILSVGVGHLDDRMSRWFLRRALSLARYVSVRDPWSRSVASTTLGGHSVELAPDLAFSYPVETPPAPVPRTGSGLTIGVSPMAYGHPELWPRSNESVFNAYVEALRLFVREMLSAGHRVVLFNTDGPDSLVVDMVFSAAGSPGPAARLERHKVDSASHLFSVLRELDMVVASRLHGVILSHLMGKPVLAVSYERKVDVHMSQFEHQHLTIDIHQVTAAALMTAFGGMQDRIPELADGVARTRDRWRSDASAQYACIAQLIGVSGSGRNEQPGAKP